MIIQFGNRARKLKHMAESKDARGLYAEFGKETADALLDALETLASVRNLNELMTFKSFRPHPLKGDKKNQLAMCVDDRVRLHISTLTEAGERTKTLDYAAEHGIVLEVSNHYGD